jgi:hypothetical protein
MTIMVVVLLLVFVIAGIICCVKKLKNKKHIADAVTGRQPYARLQQ